MIVGLSAKKNMIKLSKFGIIYLSFFVRGFILILISPHLSRVLSPSVWGRLITAQVAANWLSLIIDFGFIISAGTHLALQRDNKYIAKEIVSGVIGAKIVLSILVSIIGLTLFLSNSVGEVNNYIGSIVILAIVQGFSPLWYFQAVEKLHIFSIFDVIFRLIFIFTILRLVNDDRDTILALNLLSTCLILANVMGSYIMWRETSGWLITWRGTVSALRNGFTVFLFTITTSIYNSASIFMLAFFATPITVAIYGNAERIVRAVVSIIGPLNQILMPKSARLYQSSRRGGIIFSNKLLVLYFVLGIVLYGLILIFSQNIIIAMYGIKYIKSVFVIKTLGVLIPIICINTVLSFHFLVPSGKYNQMTRIYMSVSAISALSILLLVPKYQTNGMLFAVIFPEICALVLLSVYIKRNIIGEKVLSI